MIWLNLFQNERLTDSLTVTEQNYNQTYKAMAEAKERFVKIQVQAREQRTRFVANEAELVKARDLIESQKATIASNAEQGSWEAAKQSLEEQHAEALALARQNAAAPAEDLAAALKTAVRVVQHSHTKLNISAG